MTRFGPALPQLGEQLFLTDGGIETTLIFLEGLELPAFAAFVLLDTVAGQEALRSYYRRHAAIARDHQLGFILESPTWRANPDWGQKLGYNAARLAQANARAISLLHDLRNELQNPGTPMVISGCIGPRDDGYRPAALMGADTAAAYHSTQARVFADADADMLTAITMTYADEAIGVVRAAQQAALPVAISFTVETDGRLPSGQPLGEAITAVDEATDGAAAYFMLNCAHPSHFDFLLAEHPPWAARIVGLRANASTCSHAELDEATELDSGDPADLARRYAGLQQLLPKLNVLGGCCGTDHRHIGAIAAAVRGAAHSSENPQDCQRA